MSATTLDISSVRQQFPALASSTAFLDAPAGTQVPSSVIEAMASNLEHANANLGGVFAASRRSAAVVARARASMAAFVGGTADEIGFGANMTTLNFSLSRAAARTFGPDDEIVVTRIDHDANIAPWLHLARDLGMTVRFVDVHTPACTIDFDDLERAVGPRTRVVAFPWSSNAVGTTTDVVRVVELAHDAGALAWIDAVHHAPHGPIDVERVGADVLLCSPYKFFGPHLGVFYARRSVVESWDAYKVRPAPDEPVGQRFESGTLPHEAIAGLTAAIDYLESLGWDAIRSHEEQLAEAFLARLPEPYRLYGVRGTSGRVPTFALTHPTLPAGAVATALAERDISVWHGDYYAPEIMARLKLADGAVRIGFVHYNTLGEVERVLAALRCLL
ncbi:MAG: cysteine desulfurase-like protein [Gaiellales bacterium]